MSGIELLEKLHHDGQSLPAIMITGDADVPMAVQAMKAGALDFIEKPIGREEVIASIERALELSRDSGKLLELRESASARLAGLTIRQRAVMDRVLVPAEQKHCCRSRHQSAYGREPPRLDHEENRVEVVARVGEIGVSCLGWRRRAATGALRLWLLGRSLWRPAPSCFAWVHLIDRFFWKALMDTIEIRGAAEAPGGRIGSGGEAEHGLTPGGDPERHPTIECQRLAGGTLIPNRAHLLANSGHDRCAGGAGGRDRPATRLDRHRPRDQLGPLSLRFPADVL
jgi:hypothetical protein